MRRLKAAHCGDAACGAATLTVVDGGPPPSTRVGRYASAATGADGLALISYWDESNRDLKVAHCASLDCRHAAVSRLDREGDVGQRTSLAIGADGRGLISYYDATRLDLKVAHCSDVYCSSAALTTLDPAGDVGSFSSVAIGPDGLGLIAYTDRTNHRLKVAHCSNPECSSASISSLAVGAAGESYPSLAIGSDGLGLIASSSGNSIFVSHCADAACSSATGTVVDSFELLIDVSLAIGADGRGLVSYYNLFLANVASVFHCSDVACTSGTRTDVGPGRQFSSVARGADGLGLISYYVAPGGDLEVMHCQDAVCGSHTQALLDTAGDVGKHTSTTIGSDGLGLVAYYDETIGQLKVAHCADVACSSAGISVVDGPTRYHPVPACRVVDTRTTASPLPGNQLRTFAVAGACGVPPDARAVMVNVIAVNPGESGDLRVYAAGAPAPNTSVINFTAGRNRANGATALLGAGGQLTVLCDMAPGSTSSTHVVLDVYGYYR